MASSGEPGHPIEAALSSLPERERRVFLLVSLEELSTPHAADVMGVAADEARDALGRAQNAMREQLVANILIVEDDAIIAYDLTETVLGMGHKVCGTAATMEEALAAAAANQPSLALMDLRLAHGGSGITTAQALRETRALPIIFVTAFAEELKQRGLDYLGPVIKKPFTREQIERAITQAVFTPRPGDAAPDACRPLGRLAHGSTATIRVIDTAGRGAEVLGSKTRIGNPPACPSPPPMTIPIATIA